MTSLGVEAKVVQELMRHASFRTTMDSYTQALDESKRHAQRRLADLIMQTWKSVTRDCCGVLWDYRR
jgi:integrase